MTSIFPIYKIQTRNSLNPHSNCTTADKKTSFYNFIIKNIQHTTLTILNTYKLILQFKYVQMKRDRNKLPHATPTSRSLPFL